MEKLIAFCGLNCATCDAQIATIKNDDELRKSTAEKWSRQFNAPNLLSSMINCTGCTEPGVKFSHCNECEIRNCALKKGLKNCGECKDLDTCALVAGIHKYVPEALANLRIHN